MERRCGERYFGQVMAVLLIVGGLAMTSCATTGRKLKRIKSNDINFSLELPVDKAPEVPKIENIDFTSDTLCVSGDDGRTEIIMNAIKDENGEMVAHDNIKAATVSARFRNIAERGGQISMSFQITVPAEIRDSKWQLRFTPHLAIMGDTTKLEEILITGEKYRRAQLRGYEQYERFLSKIITDTTKFINVRLLRIFIERNIPALARFRTDSSFVSDEEFASVYGVTEQAAIEHYTNKIAKHQNQKRIRNKKKMFRKYINIPIQSEGLRLDTIIIDNQNAFIYNYTHVTKTCPGLRKADILLSGNIYEDGKRIYTMPQVAPLTFYISSLSTLTDNSTKYLYRIIERKAEANTACYIEFRTGEHRVDESIGYNSEEIGRIKSNLRSILDDIEFDLDSIVISASASPEGREEFNNRLAQRRSIGISTYFQDWITDSISAHAGKIKFNSRSNGENWAMLDNLITTDTTLSKTEKQHYFASRAIKNKDRREKSLSGKNYYPYLRRCLYPRLRVVEFDFHLHRKGMIKDTIHTTEIDTAYMAGVQRIRDRDYLAALEVLKRYEDYNTAVAYLSLDRNASALAVLDSLPETAASCYMKAIIHSRRQEDKSAIEYYLRAVEMEPSYRHRGNLDPEISRLITRYNIIQ